jgi:hypothetical protein
MYMVTLIEPKAVSSQVKHSDAVNKTSSESVIRDEDFQEEKKCKRRNSNDTSQSAKKSTKTVPTSAAVKQPPKTESARNFFTPLRTTGMGTETRLRENQAGRHQ